MKGKKKSSFDLKFKFFIHKLICKGFFILKDMKYGKLNCIFHFKK